MTAVSTWNERHGPSTFKMCFTMTCTGESEIISRSYTIDNLVMVKFKGTAEMAEDKMKFAISISSSKHDIAKQKDIKINIESKALKYSETVDVPNSWSDWIKIGYKLPFIRGFPQLYSSTITIVVEVYEDKKESLLSKLYADSEFTDFNLATPEGSVPVHRACLAAHSDVFKTMLKGEWKEVSKGEIKIAAVTVKTLQQLKDYMYLGIVREDLRPLLLIARCYLIEDLEKQCIRKLVKRVTGKELYTLVQFACENNIPELVFSMIATIPDSAMNVASAHEQLKR